MVAHRTPVFLETHSDGVTFATGDPAVLAMPRAPSKTLTVKTCAMHTLENYCTLTISRWIVQKSHFFVCPLSSTAGEPEVPQDELPLPATLTFQGGCTLLFLPLSMPVALRRHHSASVLFSAISQELDFERKPAGYYMVLFLTIVCVGMTRPVS